jgi:hypothetical protein
LHPLQHAGLSRRSVYYQQLGSYSSLTGPLPKNAIAYAALFGPRQHDGCTHPSRSLLDNLHIDFV